ncbi:hypothetical protein HanRHA438_Chr08g0335981 [Helianthus annuus]|nr:hypothetical protein HanRHA438_Chr08g0335981 [Helianthus annuus]
MAEVLGFSSSHDVRHAQESAYGHDSLERSQNLKDSIRHVNKGFPFVAKY